MVVRARAFATPAAQRVLAARRRFRKTRLHDWIQFKVGDPAPECALRVYPTAERFRTIQILPKDLRHDSRHNPAGPLCPQRLNRSRKLKETALVHVKRARQEQ